MKDKPNKLDDIIREKMSDLGAPYRPETWDWMSERLDALDTPQVGDDPLDGIIRDKIGGLKAPYRSDTWEWLSECLEGLDEGSLAGAELQAMDEAIYDRMHRLEKPYDPNHWPMLLRKLEGNAYVGRQVIRYKAMELSLLALLFITFVRLPLPGGRDTVPPPVPPRPQAMEVPGAQDDRVAAESIAAVPERPQQAPESVPADHNTLAETAAVLTTPPLSDQQLTAVERTGMTPDASPSVQHIAGRVTLRDMDECPPNLEYSTFPIRDYKRRTCRAMCPPPGPNIRCWASTARPCWA